MILLVKLILAHLTGDFILQPAAWVKNKEQKKLKSLSLYVHALLHGLLPAILVWDTGFIGFALILALIHLIIDAIKIILQTQETKRNYFFIDQIAHIASIIIIWQCYTQDNFDYSIIISNRNILLITAVCFLSTPSSVIIKMFISLWSTTHREETETDSLGSAGKWIGILERLFVLIFVINENFEAIGFLLAAKSVFRFGDLRESRDRKLTEYILIGTLLSFGLALITGIVYLKVLEIIN